MAHDGHVLCTCMVMFTQSDYPIGLKFHQHHYVTILFNPIDQDLNMIFTKSNGLMTIFLMVMSVFSMQIMHSICHVNNFH